MSVVDPASFGVLSTLWTGMGLESVLVVKPLAFTYSWSMNIPVALESSRAIMDLVSPVSVVWSSIFRVRERQCPSFSFKVSVTRWSGTCFSQLGFHLWEGVGGSVLSGTTGGVSTDSSISGILSTCKAENQL